MSFARLRPPARFGGPPPKPSTLRPDRLRASDETLQCERLFDPPAPTGEASWICRYVVALGSAAVVLSSVTMANAQQPPAAAQQATALPGSEEIEEREGRPKPFAPDFRTGHF